MTDFDDRRSSADLSADLSTGSGTDTATDTDAPDVSSEMAPVSSPPSPVAMASIELARRRLASKRAYRATMRTLEDWAKTFELTPARFEMLAAIASHPLGTTQRTLSKALSISQGTTSRMVARLERLELVRVAPNPADARKRLLVVSEEGERRLLAAQASFFEAGYGTPDPELLN